MAIRPELVKGDLCKLSKRATNYTRSVLGNRTLIVKRAIGVKRTSDGKANIEVSYLDDGGRRKTYMVSRRELWKCVDSRTNEFKRLKAKETRHQTHNVVAEVRAIRAGNLSVDKIILKQKDVYRGGRYR